MTPLDRFQKFLAEHKLRFTRERAMVVEELFSESRHFTASDLLRRLQTKDRSMSRATVYRVLPLLLRAGLIFEVGVKGGREEQVYENTLGPHHHDHLSCESCGDVIEFEDAQIHRLLEKIVQRYGYRMRSHVLSLRGLCPACQDQIISREVGAW